MSDCRCFKSKICFEIDMTEQSDWDRQKAYRKRVMQALGLARAERDDSIECLIACAIALAHGKTTRRDFFYWIDELWDNADQIAKNDYRSTGDDR